MGFTLLTKEYPIMRAALWSFIIIWFLIGFQSGSAEEVVCMTYGWDEVNLVEQCTDWWLVDHPNCLWEPLEAYSEDD